MGKDFKGLNKRLIKFVRGGLVVWIFSWSDLGRCTCPCVPFSRIMGCLGSPVDNH
jgi:hypothetical protein